MAYIKGRGVRVEIGATFGAPVPITGVSLASPPVATKTGHGLAEFTVGYFSNVAGMLQLEGQPAQVSAPSSNTFRLDGLSTDDFLDYLSGTFTPVTQWVTLAESTSYGLDTGNRTRFDRTNVLDVIQRPGVGILSAQSLKLNLLATTTPSLALQLLETAARLRRSIILRITHPDGHVRICRGHPDLPGEDVQQGAVGTSIVELAIVGFCLRALGLYTPPVPYVPITPAPPPYYPTPAPPPTPGPPPAPDPVYPWALSLDDQTLSLDDLVLELLP